MKLSNAFGKTLCHVLERSNSLFILCQTSPFIQIILALGQENMPVMYVYLRNKKTSRKSPII